MSSYMRKFSLFSRQLSSFVQPQCVSQLLENLKCFAFGFKTESDINCFRTGIAERKLTFFYRCFVVLGAILYC